MSTAGVLTTVISLSVFMLGTVLALIWYLGSRIDRMEQRLDARIDGLGSRIDGLSDHVARLSEDVAVLKATSR